MKSKTRDVYILEKDSSFAKWIAGHFFAVRIVKIGIATRTKERRKQVDSGIVGKIIIICSYKIESASKTESFLHKKFEKNKFKPKVKKRGSGETEFFKLNNYQIAEAEAILQERSTQRFSKTFFIICLIIIVLYFVFQFLKPIL